ncbi:MAG TPA: glycoside hydrolase family 76 protein [Longimicrobium sp.]|nr:glycoside hydrolase family 76 protein [Longimicrobium sp.]
MNDASRYLAAAQAAAQVLTGPPRSWFPAGDPGNWVNNYEDFWRTPNILGALVRLMKADGSRTYEQTVLGGRASFDQYWEPQWGTPSYYDDEGWWGMSFLDADALLGASGGWTGRAVNVFNDLVAGWDGVNRGGVWQMRNPKSYPTNFKGSISNELYMALGARLASSPGVAPDPAYLAGARAVWAWLDASGLIDDQGLIWGELDANGQVYRPNVPCTYTQGVVLTGLWGLYAASADAALLDRAQQIAQGAIDHMTWPGSILRESCEVNGSCGPSDTNPALFKGIYARSLAELAVNLRSTGSPARVAAADAYAAFLRTNADAVLANYPGGVYGMDWHTPSHGYQPTGNTVYDGCLQFSAIELFLAAERVGA